MIPQNQLGLQVYNAVTDLLRDNTNLPRVHRYRIGQACEQAFRDAMRENAGQFDDPEPERQRIATMDINLFRDAITRLDAGEVHEVAVSLVELMEKQDTDATPVMFRAGDQRQFEQICVMLCEALSRYAADPAPDK